MLKRRKGALTRENCGCLRRYFRVDLDILRSRPGVFGKVTSNATVSRFFERTVKNPEVFSFGFSTLVKEL